MVGLKKDKVVEGEVTEDFERNGFTWTNKEKTLLSPFHIPKMMSSLVTGNVNGQVLC